MAHFEQESFSVAALPSESNRTPEGSGVTLKVKKDKTK